MDEEDVLLGTAPCDIGSLSEVDEAAVLGDDGAGEGTMRKDSLEEREELDYDEDIDEETEKTPRSSKFASERVDSRRSSMKSIEVSPNNEGSERRRRNSGLRNTAVDNEVNAEETRKIDRTSNEHERGLEGATTVASQMPLPSKQIRSGRKVLMNPHYKGNLHARPEFLNWGSLKSASAASLTVHLRPSIPSIAHTSLPGHPFVTIPSSSTDFSKPPPLVPMSSFSAPPPSYQMPFTAVNQPAIYPAVEDWSKKVTGFLDRIAAPMQSSRRYSRSRSRSSSSSSRSRSRSRSYSSRSSSSSESTRSSRSSRRNSRTHGHRSLSRRSGSRHLRRRSRSHSRHGDYGRVGADKRGGRYDDRKGQVRHKGFYQDPNHQEKMIECAKAIGLDNDYLTKLEEQKKMREEILRKKEERRFQNVQRMSSSDKMNGEKEGKNLPGDFSRRIESNIERTQPLIAADLTKIEKKLPRIRPGNEKNGRDGKNVKATVSDNFLKVDTVTFHARQPAQKSFRKGTDPTGQSSDGGVKLSVCEQDVRRSRVAHAKTSEQNAQAFPDRSATSGSEKVAKKKAYLAVVIGTANKKIPNLEKMKLVASTIGPFKKMWISAEDTISVVFESHDSAKQFMAKYNGKIINRVALHVSLQKVFVNLAEL